MKEIQRFLYQLLTKFQQISSIELDDIPKDPSLFNLPNTNSAKFDVGIVVGFTYFLPCRRMHIKFEEKFRFTSLLSPN